MSTQLGAQQQQQQQQTQNTSRVYQARQILVTPKEPCDGCGSEVVWFFHDIWHRCTFRRFCTACVLKLNAGRFCSVCYEVFDPACLPADRIFCLKCNSIVHHGCVKEEREKAALYFCPPCSDPRFVYFGPEEAKDGINLNFAKQLRAAALIANTSIKRVAALANLELARWAAESRKAWKNVHYALDYLRFLEEREQGMKVALVGVPGLLAPVRAAACGIRINAEGSGRCSTEKRKGVVQDIPEKDVPSQGVSSSSIMQITPIANRRRTYMKTDKGKVCVASSLEKPTSHVKADKGKKIRNKWLTSSSSLVRFKALGSCTKAYWDEIVLTSKENH